MKSVSCETGCPPDAFHQDPPPWKRTFAFAFVAQILSMIGFAFFVPFLPFFIGDLGVHTIGEQAFWAGIVISASAFTLIIFAPIWGTIADRHGRKQMVCRAMFASSIILVLMSLVRTVPQLVLLRVIQGAFTGTMSANIALVASVVPLERSGFALGMMQAAVEIGNCIGPFLGGMAADAIGYRGSFRIGALITLTAGMLVLFGVREAFPGPRNDEGRQSPGFGAILRLQGFLVGVFILFAVRLSNNIANPSFPLIVKEIVGQSPSLNSITGSVIAAAAIASAASAALLGYIGDRIGRRGVLLTCCIGVSIAAIGHFAAHSLSTLFPARILFGFAVAGMLPSANAMIHAVVDRTAMGKAYGLATSLSMVGNAVGPSLGGYLAMTLGLRVPFLVTAAGHLFLAAFILAVVPGGRTTAGTSQRLPSSLPPE